MAQNETEQFIPYTDLPYPASPPSDPNTIYQSQFVSARQMQVGSGAKVFRVDKQGMWLGAEHFVDAPFRVDMLGNVFASNITLGGYIPTGGAAADVNAGVGTVNANRINAATLSAISADLGTITAGSITGITITGSVLQTATSGKRIIISNSTNDIVIYDSGGTKVGTIFGSSSSLWLQANVASANITFANGATLLATLDENGNFALAPSGADFYVPSNGRYAWLSRTVYLSSPSDLMAQVNGNLNVTSNLFVAGVDFLDHVSDASAHHSRYTDSEARSAVVASGLSGSLRPSSSNVYDLGTSSAYWQDVYLYYAQFNGSGGTIYFNGAKVFDMFAANVEVGKNITPDADNNKTCGSSGKRWADVRSVLINGSSFLSEKDVRKSIEGYDFLSHMPRLIEFTWKADKKKKVYWGFAADDMPETIANEKEKAVNVLGSVAYAYGAIKQLEKRVKQLEEAKK